MTEEIRAAFAALAEQAPRPERVLATLAGRARHYRQRRLTLQLAGVAAAASALGGAGVLGRSLFAPAVPGPDLSVPEQAGSADGGVLMRYRPTWLPLGLGEAERSVVFDEAGVARLVSRNYRPGVSLHIGWSEAVAWMFDSAQRDAQTVDINGVSGLTFHRPDGQTDVCWQGPTGPQLRIVVQPPWAEDAVRIARSVRPDPTATLKIGLRFGWLPDELLHTSRLFDVSTLITDWMQSYVLPPNRLSTTARPPRLSVVIGPDVLEGTLNAKPPLATVPVQVRGLDGVTDTTGQRLYVTLPDGVQLGLDATTPMDLVRIADTMELGSAPDLSWVGTR